VAAEPIDIFEHPGWKTQFEAIEPNVTMKHEDDIFYGFGNCPHKKLTPVDLQNAKTDDEVLDFYMGLLRTYCIQRQKHYFRTLIQSGYLEVTKDKLIQVPETNKAV
jgi:hypothetical protein